MLSYTQQILCENVLPYSQQLFIVLIRGTWPNKQLTLILMEVNISYGFCRANVMMLYYVVECNIAKLVISCYRIIFNDKKKLLFDQSIFRTLPICKTQELRHKLTRAFSYHTGNGTGIKAVRGREGVHRGSPNARQAIALRLDTQTAGKILPDRSQGHHQPGRFSSGLQSRRNRQRGCHHQGP